jgi:hypothetical protein
VIARPSPSSPRVPAGTDPVLRPVVGPAPSGSRLGFLVRVGSLEVQLPDGSRRLLRGSRPGPAAEITVHRPGLAGRLLRGGAMGLAEAYLDGDFDSPDLPTLLELMTRNTEAWLESPVGRLREPASRAWDRLRGPRSRGVR